MTQLLENIARHYHVESRNNLGYKFIKNQHLVHYREDITQLKNVKPVEAKGDRVALPLAQLPDDKSLREVLYERKSHRDFDGSSISATQLATILYYANGYKSMNSEFGTTFRKFVPSSGGLNSVEVFAIVLNVDGVEQGIYHYDSERHEIIRIAQGDYTTWTREHIFYQTEYADASVVLVLASAFGKLAQKYGLRAYRLSLLDVGHISQNVYLCSTAMGLKICASAGFIDDELDEALCIDGNDVASFLTLMIG
ncbi:MAG: SagB/ThcOx family dehydrogenase [Bacteroidota bacterium]